MLVRARLQDEVGAGHDKDDRHEVRLEGVGDHGERLEEDLGKREETDDAGEHDGDAARRRQQVDDEEPYRQRREEDAGGLSLQAEDRRDDEPEPEADHRRRRDEVDELSRARYVRDSEREAEEQEEVRARVADTSYLHEDGEADGKEDRSAEDAAAAGDPAHARQSTRRAGVRAAVAARPWPGGSAVGPAAIPRTSGRFRC